MQDEIKNTTTASPINSHYIIILAVFIIGGMIGYGIHVGTGKKTTNAKLEAQIERAKKFYPPLNDVRTLSGVVENISSSSITLKIQPPPNPFEEWPLARTVSITENTKITFRKSKDPQVYSKEIQEYQQDVQELQKGNTGKFAPGEFPTPPDPFTIADLSLSDIKEGMQISVNAANNIKDTVSFEATTITILESSGT